MEMIQTIEYPIGNRRRRAVIKAEIEFLLSCFTSPNNVGKQPLDHFGSLVGIYHCKQINTIFVENF